MARFQAPAWLMRHETSLAALILILVLHVCFFPFLWGDKTLLAAARDVPSVMPNGAWYGDSQGPSIYRANDMGAAAWVMEASAPLLHWQYFHEHALPLWNPYQSYGAPLAANMQSQAFNPLFILYALHPGPRTFDWFIVCRFFIAGLCAYLYLRLFLPFAPSITGGIACMLSGYYILFYDMPHLSVDMLVPAIFLSLERLLRQQSIGNVLLSVAVIFLSIVGGMPESTLLVLAFGFVYFGFRLVSDPGLRVEGAKHVKYLLFATAVGFALAGILLGPFVEFMRISFDLHQPRNIHGLITGLHPDHLGSGIFTYLVPALFGPTWSPIIPGLCGYCQLHGYFGILQFLFAILAVVGLLSKNRSFDGERYLILFFSLASVAIVLKRFGSPLVNWIGSLPFFQLVLFPKYEEPLLGFAVAVLCAFGVHRLLTSDTNHRSFALPLLIAFLSLAGALVSSLPMVYAAKASAHTFYLSLGGAMAILFLGGLAILAGPLRSACLAPTLILLLVAEMAGNYIYPLYYGLTHSARDASNPYLGAPYLDYLNSNVQANERIFGRDGLLHPDWAGSFQLADVRGLDAMYYRKYFTFVRAFLYGGRPVPSKGEQVDRFTGLGEYGFDSPVERRLLQLSSVKYLLSLHPYGRISRLVPEILHQNQGRLFPGRENLIEIRAFTIAGITKSVLYEHPLYERLPFRFEVTPIRREFLFDVAMDPAVYSGPAPICGDGVEFRLEIRDSKGRVEPLYTHYIDPKANLAERKWIPGSVNLSKYLGQTVELLFTTTPGPAGNSCMDWAGWGDPHFNGDVETEQAFRPIYDHEVKIYEYRDILPRAALFSNVEVAANDEAALVRLATPSLDVFQTAVVSTVDLKEQDREFIQQMNKLPPVRALAAKILSYRSQEVRIEASVERPALLVLNDSDYPGWKVYVDGQRSRWITSNYLFRGVLLRPGRHLVRFAYEPASFAVGASLSGAGFLCLAGFIGWRKLQPVA